MGNELLTWVNSHRLLSIILASVATLGLGLVVLVALMRPPVTAASIETAATTTSQASRTSVTKRSQPSVLKESVSGPIYVDVKGAVKQPGLYRVTAAMRVADAIELAKGLLPQADQRQVNLAAKVVDQQVIYVPVKGEQLPAIAAPAATSQPETATTAGGTPKAGSKTTGAKGKINLNTADVAALQKLAGVGQKKAEKIIAFRNEHGGFKSVAELKKVGGFGDKTLAKFQDQLTV